MLRFIGLRNVREQLCAVDGNPSLVDDGLDPVAVEGFGFDQQGIGGVQGRGGAFGVAGLRQRLSLIHVRTGAEDALETFARLRARLKCAPRQLKAEPLAKQATDLIG